MKKSDWHGYGIQLRESKHSERDQVEQHHHQIYQILYAMEDEGNVTLNGKSYPFNQDHVAFIPPFSEHAITAHSKLVVLILEFGGDALDRDIRDHLIDHYFEQAELIKLNLFEANEIRQILRKMLYEQAMGRFINFLAMKVYLAELLFILARSQEEPEIRDANVLRADRIRRYIDTHYFNVMNASDISSKLGISTRHVNTIFKDQYGMTPIQYLAKVRMEKAKKLLIETDKDIVSICFEVGFESLSTFYRTFKHDTQTSPKKYRSAHQYSRAPHH